MEGRGGRIPESSYEANYMFVSLPINLSYYLPISQSGDIVFSAGGYYGVNFGGKYKSIVDFTETGVEIIDEDDMQYGNLRSLDVMITA